MTASYMARDVIPKDVIRYQAGDHTVYEVHTTPTGEVTLVLTDGCTLTRLGTALVTVTTAAQRPRRPRGQ